MMNDTATHEADMLSMLTCVTGASEEQARQALMDSGGDMDVAAAILLSNDDVNMDGRFDGAEDEASDAKTPSKSTMQATPGHKGTSGYSVGRHKEEADDECTAQPGTSASISPMTSTSNTTGPRHKQTVNVAANIATNRMRTSRRPPPPRTTTPPASSLAMSLTKSRPATDTARERNSPMSPRPLRSTTVPGAFRVDDSDTSTYDNDESSYTVTAQQTKPSDKVESVVSPMEPLTARVVHGSEDDVEELQGQLRAHEERLDQIWRQVANAAVAEVIPTNNDEEAAIRSHGFDGDSPRVGPDSSTQEEEEEPCVKWCTPIMDNNRKKLILAVVIIAVMAAIGSVIGVVLSQQTSSSPPTAASRAQCIADTIILLDSPEVKAAIDTWVNDWAAAEIDCTTTSSGVECKLDSKAFPSHDNLVSACQRAGGISYLFTYTSICDVVLATGGGDAEIIYEVIDVPECAAASSCTAADLEEIADTFWADDYAEGFETSFVEADEFDNAQCIASDPTGRPA